MKTPKPRARRARDGFTLIEVMISLGVMMVGGMAIIAMQQQTLVANNHSRQITTATLIAQTWLERLKQDAATWTQIGFLGVAGQPTAAQVLVGTTYLQNVAATPDTWLDFPITTLATGETLSPAFDFNGNDLAAFTVPATHHYCASYRLSWVFFGRAIRADVRVHWPNYRVRGAGANPYADGAWTTCSQNAPAGLGVLLPGGTFVDDFHAIHVPTVIRVNNLVN